jgi:hypothetical protein
MAVGAIIDFLSREDLYRLTPDPRNALNKNKEEP